MQRFITIKNLTERKKEKLKSLIGFLLLIKLTTTTEGEKRKKKSKSMYRANQKIRIINVFLESLLSESFPSLGVAVHLTSLGWPLTLCWSLDLLWGASQILIWSYFCVFLPPMSTAIRVSAFSFVGALHGLSYSPSTQNLLN